MRSTGFCFVCKLKTILGALFLLNVSSLLRGEQSLFYYDLATVMALVTQHSIV